MNTDTQECRAFVAHIQAEHRHMHQRISELQALFAQQHRQCGEKLQALHQELVHHFEEEETGGCLEEAVARCPAVADEAERLLAEHGVLLSDFEQLVRQFEAGTGPAADWQATLHALSERLFQHEAAENQVLERAFGLDCE